MARRPQTKKKYTFDDIPGFRKYVEIPELLPNTDMQIAYIIADSDPAAGVVADLAFNLRRVLVAQYDEPMQAWIAWPVFRRLLDTFGYEYNNEDLPPEAFIAYP